MKIVGSLLAGAAAGTMATIAMSAVMLGAKRAGITGTLPPELITDRAIEAVTHARPSHDEEEAAVAVAHLGFGAAAGALFALFTTGAGQRSAPIAAALGALYATGIWFVSYQGWVPALGIMPPASRDRRGRVATMLIAHWVYGATLGIFATLLRR